ncbi:MAG: aminoacyl-tRNA hydrolase [Chloroflexi bacterium]|jgi:PTH1 family peptidyl-tRNA hydrolase|nr:aminoacyl-tRNA hydrolase [Chloroflexota bacterium]MBV6436185.1 Peptidyl-tRNA hydrolase [Anaerolineae bacterium]MDL1915023.1 aminoacyl-tRNA hydrolase [Anaerolineae bacterium CFX4]MBW7879628.1 aminoacyl-tRNA hydrolase [Anaerolineae bacterium]MCC6564292.1 aminoacyl-tRNA hydrolase [Chloroflexota bacterium]
MSERWLIAGLGNPGPQYENTRHNMGFKVVETLAKRHGLTFSRTEKRASVADGLIVGRRVLLAKPLTYMNESGVAVRGLIDFYKIDINKLIVAADDLDLPLGTLRLRNGGGDGGQRGVRSIIQHLGTREFARARCGIGRPPGQMDPAAYVLRPFMGDDIINAQIMVEHAADAVETWLTDGLELAMTRHNGIVV